MLLKKQTVWLLTMLSLVFVLSAYYFIGDQKANEQMASNPTEQNTNNESAENHEGHDGDATDADGEEGTEGAEASDDDSAVVKYISTDDTFAEMRYELDNLRSAHRAELNDRMASTNLPAEEISKAADQLNELASVSEKEFALETQIRSSHKEIQDVLVRVTDGKIWVAVKAQDHTAQMANDIYHMVRQEFNEVRNENFALEFSPSEKDTEE
ncbi:SpoIIIAH-like family protein [Sutcliffiella rhizosphaerae]|uniref:Stage III sporulation protein AH n=1 Tax=Sutcliffiella rhizosphaerae TaxID=2880967 RepID=A0ABM8YTA1_9BACI|nr:SpoIIIAH-like family protein [Sutcliffiella rhizosphaerae]CAG9623173.1 Stage III sporulation protein AH [Sutcliffiella rhizosphaerae]